MVRNDSLSELDNLAKVDKSHIVYNFSGSYKVGGRMVRAPSCVHARTVFIVLVLLLAVCSSWDYDSGWSGEFSAENGGMRVLTGFGTCPSHVKVDMKVKGDLTGQSDEWYRIKADGIDVFYTDAKICTCSTIDPNPGCSYGSGSRGCGWSSAFTFDVTDQAGDGSVTLRFQIGSCVVMFGTDAFGNVRVYADHSTYIWDEVNGVCRPPIRFVHFATIGESGVAGSDGSHLRNPHRLTVGADGNIYVADGGNHRVQIFNPDLSLHATVGTGAAGSGNDAFNDPGDVGLDPFGRGGVVADKGNHRIQVYDANRNYFTTKGTGDPGSGADEFNNPAGIGVAPDGTIYIADEFNDRVQVFDRDVNLVGSMTGLANPTDVAFDLMGRIFVAAREAHAVQVFDAARNPVATIGIAGQAGTGNDQFEMPTGIAVDQAGRIYVADDWNHRVQVFDSDLGYLTTIGLTKNPGLGNDQLRNPVGVAVSPNGLLFVSEWGNHRVQVFTQDGAELTSCELDGDCISGRCIKEVEAATGACGCDGDPAGECYHNGACLDEGTVVERNGEPLVCREREWFDSDHDPSACESTSTGLWRAGKGCCDADDVWCSHDGRHIVSEAVLEGHTLAVNGVYADANYVYSASDDGTVRVWDRSDDTLVTSLEGHGDRVNGVYADDEYVYTCARDNTARVWDRATFEEVAVLEGHTDYVWDVYADETRIYTASRDGTVRIWDRTTFEEVTVLEGHSGDVTFVYADDERIYTASADRTARVWDKEDPSQVTELEGHTGNVRTVLVDGDRLYTASYDGTVRVWDRVDLSPVSLIAAHDTAVYDVAADEGHLYTSSLDLTVRVWDKGDLTLVRTLEGHTGGVLTVFADGGDVFSTSTDRTVRVWSWKEYEPGTSVDPDEWYCFHGDRVGISDLTPATCSCLSPGCAWDAQNTVRMCCDPWDDWCRLPEDVGSEPGPVDAFFASYEGMQALLDINTATADFSRYLRETFIVEDVFSITDPEPAADPDVIADRDALVLAATDAFHFLARDVLRRRANRKVKDIIDTPLFLRPEDPAGEILADISSGLTAAELAEVASHAENHTYVSTVQERIRTESIPITMRVVENVLGDDALGDEVRDRLITHAWGVVSQRVRFDAAVFSRTALLDGFLAGLDTVDDVAWVEAKFQNVGRLISLLETDPEMGVCGDWFERGGCGGWKVYPVDPGRVRIRVWNCDEPGCTCNTPRFTVNNVFPANVRAYTLPQAFDLTTASGSGWEVTFIASTDRIKVESDGCFFIEVSQGEALHPARQDIQGEPPGSGCDFDFNEGACGQWKEYETVPGRMEPVGLELTLAGAPLCGDGTCGSGETAATCPHDCASLPCTDHADCYGGACLDGQCYALEEIAADPCGDDSLGSVNRGSSPFPGTWCKVRDCCCCYIKYHDHDLGRVVSPDVLRVQFEANFGTMVGADVSVSSDGSVWSPLSSTDSSTKYQPSNTTFDVRGQSFRYVRVKAPVGRVNDASDVWAYRLSPYGPYAVAIHQPGITIGNPPPACGTPPCTYNITFGPTSTYRRLRIETSLPLYITVALASAEERALEPLLQDEVALSDAERSEVLRDLLAILEEAPADLETGRWLQDLGAEAVQVLDLSTNATHARDALDSVGLDLDNAELTAEALATLVNATWRALQLDMEGSEEMMDEAVAMARQASREVRIRENVQAIAEQALVKAVLDQDLAGGPRKERLARLIGARTVVVDVYSRVLGQEAAAELVARLDLAIAELGKDAPDEAVIEQALTFVRENIPEVRRMSATDIPVLSMGRGELAASARVASGLSADMAEEVQRMQRLVEGTAVNASVDTYLVNSKQVSVFTMSIENEGNKELKDVGMPLKIAKCHLSWFSDANFDEKPSMVRPDPLVLWNLGNLRPKQKTELKFSTTRIFCSDGSTCSGGAFCADICLNLGQCATSCQVCGQKCDTGSGKDEICSIDGPCVKRGLKLRNERCGCDIECETDNCVRSVCCEKNEFADASGQCTATVNMMNVKIDDVMIPLGDELVLPVHLINPLSRGSEVNLTLVEGGSFAALSKNKVFLEAGEKRLVGLRLSGYQTGTHAVVIDLHSTDNLRESLSVTVKVLTSADPMGIEMRTAPGPGLPLLTVLAAVCALWTSTGRRRDSD